MDLLNHLALGFGVALTPVNLLYAFIGVLLGTLIGVLPGIGPVATIAMLLPTTYALQPVSALIMLAGIYYGAQYGGSTTAILVNMPGESSSVVTCLDGHQMARRGPGRRRAGGRGAGVVLRRNRRHGAGRGGVDAAVRARTEVRAGRILLADGARPDRRRRARARLADQGDRDDRPGAVARHHRHGRQLRRRALRLRHSRAVRRHRRRGCRDGAVRLRRDHPESRIDRQARDRHHQAQGSVAHARRSSRPHCPAVLRGTGLGSVLGVLPGGGAMLSAFASYTIEKKIAKDPSIFGKGAIQGVAGPEAANNAGAQTSFIPLLTLGIPENAVMAMMVGAMTIHNIQPGPQVMTSNPGLFWGLIASMWIGNLMLVVLNLPLIGMWIKLLAVPYRMLYPAILLFCAIGVYTMNNTSFDMMQTALFGLLGVLFVKLECEPAPLLLGFVLGPDDGGEPAARAAAVARRSDRVRARGRFPPDAADRRRAADRRSSGCRTSASASARKRSRNEVRNCQ